MNDLMHGGTARILIGSPQSTAHVLFAAQRHIITDILNKHVVPHDDRSVIGTAQETGHLIKQWPHQQYELDRCPSASKQILLNKNHTSQKEPIKRAMPDSVSTAPAWFHL